MPNIFSALGNPKVLIALAVLSVFLVGSYYAVSLSNLPYGGGGEIGTSYSRVFIDSQEFGIWGQHNWPNLGRYNYSDIDTSFDDHDWSLAHYTTTSLNHDDMEAIDGTKLYDIKKPSILLESGYAYYLERLSQTVYESSPTAVAERQYEKTYGNVTYRYELYNYGIDVTLKTSADKFYCDIFSFGTFSNWGWDYESRSVSVSALLNFGISPWVPAGVWNASADGKTHYDIIGGWAGVMQAQVYAVEYGVLENERLEQELAELPDGARYEMDTTNQDLNSQLTALNMYEPDTRDLYQPIDFNTPDALVGIPSAVDIEVGATLGAGAVHTADFLAHWNALAVRNVYVTYRIVVKLVTTLELEFVTEGDPISVPAEGNTAGDPPAVPVVSASQQAWQEFWTDAQEWLRSPEGIFYAILIAIVIVAVAVLVLRLFVFSRSGR